MSDLSDSLKPDRLRAALGSFWADALEIEQTSKGLVMAVPQTGSDGWQIVVEFMPATPGSVRLSDGGRSLGELMATGQNIETDAMTRQIDTILRESHMEREGIEIFRWLPLPVDPAEVHVFAEALSGISYLHILHEPVVRSQDVADQTLRQVFRDRRIEPREGAVLQGRTENRIRVDYLVGSNREVAFQILRRRGRILPTMEQWGYRWQDLKKVHRALSPVMLFDPANQTIDRASRAIGNEICELFCSYEETDRIHEVLERVA